MRITRSDDGQAVVEFTFMLPFFLLFVMLLVEFGFMFFTYITLNNATSEAARWASVANVPSTSCAANSVQWRASQMSNGFVNCTNSTIDVRYQDTATRPARGTGVSVQVTRDYTPLTPLPGFFTFVSWGAFPSPFTFRACSDARLESTMPPPGGTPYLTGPGTCGS